MFFSGEPLLETWTTPPKRQNKACQQHAPQVSGAVSSHCRGTSAVKAWELLHCSRDWAVIGLKGWCQNHWVLQSENPVLEFNIVFLFNNLFGSYSMLVKPYEWRVETVERPFFSRAKALKEHVVPIGACTDIPQGAKTLIICNYKKIFGILENVLFCPKEFYDKGPCSNAPLGELLLSLPSLQPHYGSACCTDPGSPKGQLLPHAAVD